MLFQILKENLEGTTGDIETSHLLGIVNELQQELKNTDYEQIAEKAADLYNYDPEFANGYESGFKAGIEFLINSLNIENNETK